MAQPALADVDGGCRGTFEVCLFQDTNYNTDSTEKHWADFTSNDSNFNNNHWYDANGAETTDGLNDELTSLKNRRGCTVVLYRSSNYGGTSESFAADANDSNLGNNRIGSNQASSLRMGC